MVPVQPLLQGCKRTFCTKDSRSAVLMLQLQQHHGRAACHRPRSFFAALSSLPIRWNEASPPCGSVTNLRSTPVSIVSGCQQTACLACQVMNLEKSSGSFEKRKSTC